MENQSNVSTVAGFESVKSEEKSNVQILADYQMTWFHKMDGFLNWKIIPPDFNNPFKPPLPDRVLVELVSRKEVLMTLFNLRCLCDGHEVLLVRNLASPLMLTDHPCISQLTRNQVFDYLEEQGIDRKIGEEVERVRQEIREELQKREYIAKQNKARKQDMFNKEKSALSKPASNNGAGFRVIRG